MKGYFTKITDKGFGFIKSSENDKEYFCHKGAFKGKWFSLMEEVNSGMHVEVSFDPEDSPKGLRAENVRRI